MADSKKPADDKTEPEKSDIFKTASDRKADAPEPEPSWRRVNHSDSISPGGLPKNL